MADGTDIGGRRDPAGGRAAGDSAWPLVLGVAVAALAVGGALLSKAEWGGDADAAATQGGETYAGRIDAYCRRADGSTSLLSQTHECPTSATLELRLVTADPRAKYGAWLLFGNGEVAAGDWGFPSNASITMPLQNAQPAAYALVGLFTDRSIDARALHEYLTTPGQAPEHVMPQVEYLERRVNQWRREGRVVGVRTLTFRVKRG